MLEVLEGKKEDTTPFLVPMLFRYLLLELLSVVLLLPLQSIFCVNGSCFFFYINNQFKNDKIAVKQISLNIKCLFQNNTCSNGLLKSFHLFSGQWQTPHPHCWSVLSIPGRLHSLSSPLVKRNRNEKKLRKRDKLSLLFFNHLTCMNIHTSNQSYWMVCSHNWPRPRYAFAFFYPPAPAPWSTPPPPQSPGPKASPAGHSASEVLTSDPRPPQGQGSGCRLWGAKACAIPWCPLWEWPHLFGREVAVWKEHLPGCQGVANGARNVKGNVCLTTVWDNIRSEAST